MMTVATGTTMIAVLVMTDDRDGSDRHTQAQNCVFRFWIYDKNATSPSFPSNLKLEIQGGTTRRYFISAVFRNIKDTAGVDPLSSPSMSRWRFGLLRERTCTLLGWWTGDLVTPLFLSFVANRKTNGGQSFLVNLRVKYVALWKFRNHNFALSRVNQPSIQGQVWARSCCVIPWWLRSLL